MKGIRWECYLWPLRLTWLEWSPASDDPTLFPLTLRAGGCCGLAGDCHVSYQCGRGAEVVSAPLRNRERALLKSD